MTKDQYVQITDYTRALTEKSPLGASFLRIPTWICAAAYGLCLALLAVTGDERLYRAMLVPFLCFALVTFLRPVIGRERPYDTFTVPPIGKYKPGKGKSMPSRHTASAAAIAFAVIYAYPHPAVWLFMLSLSVLIAVLRILSGQHYPSDVFAGFLLSACVSLLGYVLIP